MGGVVWLGVFVVFGFGVDMFVNFVCFLMLRGVLVVFFWAGVWSRLGRFLRI